MEISTKAVKGGGMIIGCGMVTVPRQLAEKHQAVPSIDRIEQAKVQFVSVGLAGAKALVEALQMLETEGKCYRLLWLHTRSRRSDAKTA